MAPCEWSSKQPAKPASTQNSRTFFSTAVSGIKRPSLLVFFEGVAEFLVKIDGNFVVFCGR
jgi:hypothetical protein